MKTDNTEHKFCHACCQIPVLNQRVKEAHILHDLLFFVSTTRDIEECTRRFLRIGHKACD